MADSILTAERLREVLFYERDTGIFTWVIHRGSNLCGQRAGSSAANGYRRIGAFGRQYYEHRLAWLYVTGMWPTSEIDHVNRVKTDNRFVNLRLATNAQNQQNKLALKTNKIGVKGVCFDKERRRWRAQIKLNGKNIYIGRFLTIEQAKIAYEKKVERLHPYRPLVQGLL